jgi:hypothetical protein
MDPTLYYSIVKSSFSEDKKEYKLPKYKNDSVDFSLAAQGKTNTNKILSIKVPNPKFNIDLGKSIFKFYRSVIFANLDALSFGVKHYNGSMKFSADDPYLDITQIDDLKQADKNFSSSINTTSLKPNVITSLIISDDTTGTIDYIKFRKPEAICFTLNSVNTDKSVNLNPTGIIDLNVDWEQAVSQLQKSASLGVDLIVDYSNNNLKTVLLIAVYSINNSGTFIYKLPFTEELNIKFLYMCSLFFNEISIVKPLSDLNNLYLIAKNKKIINDRLLEFLKLMTNDFQVDIPMDFINWIDGVKNSLNIEIKNRIDVYKPFIIWNIPDNKKI